MACFAGPLLFLSSCAAVEKAAGRVDEVGAAVLANEPQVVRILDTAERVIPDVQAKVNAVAGEVMALAPVVREVAIDVRDTLTWAKGKRAAVDQIVWWLGGGLVLTAGGWTFHFLRSRHIRTALDRVLHLLDDSVPAAVTLDAHPAVAAELVRARRRRLA